MAGYRLYRNGSVVATTTNSDYSYTGLACDTSHTLAVEAYDSAGNSLKPRRSHHHPRHHGVPGRTDTQAPSASRRA